MKKSDSVQRLKLRSIVRLVPRTALLVGILITGCASQPELSVEEQAGNRALQWAEALISQDYDKALTFMTPSYQSSPRASRFRGDFGGAAFWDGAEIKWVKCDEEDNSPIASLDDTSAIESADPSGASDVNVPSNSADSLASSAEKDCTVSPWESCGETGNTSAQARSSFSQNSAVMSSSRCEVRLILSVMKPPELPTYIPVPYEAVWLNIDGTWYMYR